MKIRNPVARDLRSPKYIKRVVKDRTKYTRKTKHKPRPPSRGYCRSCRKCCTEVG